MSVKQCLAATAAASVLLLMSACKSDGASDGAADGDASADASAMAKSGDGKSAAQTSPGKPSAPISFKYRILGTAIVGQPVPVEVEISSTVRDRPIAVSYHVSDAASMTFPESQARRVDVSIAEDEGKTARQVTVVPQREGRLYLNVLAEVETDAGRMIKSIAIPISVGRAVDEPETNGELKEGSDGEAVISLPAEEN